MAAADPFPSAAPGAPLCPSTTTPEEGTAAWSTVPSANWTSTVAAPAPAWASTQVAGAPSALPISPTWTSTSTPLAPLNNGSEAVPTAAVSETSRVSWVVVRHPSCWGGSTGSSGPTAVPGPALVPEPTVVPVSAGGLTTVPGGTAVECTDADPEPAAPEAAPFAVPLGAGVITLGVGTGADPPAPAGWSKAVICTPSDEVCPKMRCNDADAEGATSMGAVVGALDWVGAPTTPGAAPLKAGIGTILAAPPPWATWSPGLEAVTVPDSGRTSTPSRRSR